jgi:hypothetical protein
MTEPPRFHPAVAEGLSEAIDHYRQADSGLPRRMRADLRAALDLVEAFPFLGGTVFEDYRHAALRVPPDMAVDRLDGETDRILAVVHARRDPMRIRRLLEGRQRDEAGDAPMAPVLPLEPR